MLVHVDLISLFGELLKEVLKRLKDWKISLDI